MGIRPGPAERPRSASTRWRAAGMVTTHCGRSGYYSACARTCLSIAGTNQARSALARLPARDPADQELLMPRRSPLAEDLGVLPSHVRQRHPLQHGDLLADIQRHAVPPLRFSICANCRSHKGGRAWAPQACLLRTPLTRWPQALGRAAECGGGGECPWRRWRRPPGDVRRGSGRSHARSNGTTLTSGSIRPQRFALRDGHCRRDGQKSLLVLTYPVLLGVVSVDPRAAFPCRSREDEGKWQCLSFCRR